MKKLTFVLPICGFLGTPFCSDLFAQNWTWTQANLPMGGSWQNLACSADGSKMIASSGPNLVCISTNGGATWATNWFTGNGFVVACTYDASRIFALSASNGKPYLYCSTNLGLTWSSNNPPIQAQQSLACSADGSLLIAGAGDGYGAALSRDGGLTWSNSETAGWGGYWLADCSPDGNFLFACTTSGGAKSVSSSDSGVTWHTNDLPAEFWQWCGCSAGGKLFAIADESSRCLLFRSTDSGATWTSNSLPVYFRAIATSPDGSKLTGAGPWVYTSDDSGATWAGPLNNLPGSEVYSVATSADGNKILAGGYNVYIGQTIPKPYLSISTSDNLVTLSWMIPSGNFVLQQNTDLTSTNWAPVTNHPVVNLTNLHYEVSLPVPTSNQFFRLSMAP